MQTWAKTQILTGDIECSLDTDALIGATPNLPTGRSILAGYVTDVDDSGTYMLRLDERETKKLWDEVDAQTLLVQRLRARLRETITEVRHARADATAAPSVEGPSKSRPGPER